MAGQMAVAVNGDLQHAMGSTAAGAVAAALCDNEASGKPPMHPMTVQKDAFRRFQEELAALDSKNEPSSSKTTSLTRLDHARADFLALRRRYGLTVADVVAFFPEEEGIAYLQQLIVANEAKPARAKKR